MAVQFPMYVVNLTIPLVVQLNPNPKSISMQLNKVYNKTQTLGGWVYEHWGEQPQTLKVTGRTQGMQGNYSNEVAIEAALFQLQQLFRLDKREISSLLPRMNDTNFLFSGTSNVTNWLNGTLDPADLLQLSQTIIYYRYDAYQGFFTDFKWSQDAETTPKHFEYEFTYMVTLSAQNMLADLLFTPSNAGITAARQALGVAASVPGVVNAVKGIVAIANSIVSAV